MLGIWCGGDWLKERFGSAQSMVGWYMKVPELAGFSYANKSSFSFGIFMRKWACHYVALNVVSSLIYLWLFVVYKLVLGQS